MSRTNVKRAKSGSATTPRASMTPSEKDSVHGVDEASEGLVLREQPRFRRSRAEPGVRSPRRFRPADSSPEKANSEAGQRGQ